MEYVEIEHKYLVDDPAPLRAVLAGRGGEPGPAVRQVDTYYNAPHRDLLERPVVTEWLRIRRTDGGASLNFKKWHLDDDGLATHCDEYESDVTDAEAVRRTLRALDFTQMVRVDKVREEWTLPGGRIVVAFDTLASLGSFVEFEFKGDAETVPAAIEELTAFVGELGVPLGERIHRGYPHMLLGRDR
ncbi:class IV adenylate cyclase [Actinomadura decatromicini]|uniref:Class IV adenylate cyclase n=1 Tax=Actinomadura decatromicini TaxID=2604572 RepID=A0A5D3F874_9ACTN|nr:class IV adenylate cyclase [Actinomadura decatromicini]TYK44511.1 class IV adenylate cyclase [Actinomadura decatromicini]